VQDNLQKELVGANKISCRQLFPLLLKRFSFPFMDAVLSHWLLWVQTFIGPKQENSGTKSINYIYYSGKNRALTTSWGMHSHSLQYAKRRSVPHLILQQILNAQLNTSFFLMETRFSTVKWGHIFPQSFCRSSILSTN